LFAIASLAGRALKQKSVNRRLTPGSEARRTSQNSRTQTVLSNSTDDDRAVRRAAAGHGGNAVCGVSNKQIPFRKLGPHKNAAVRFDFDEVNEWSKECGNG
jgi:hypothetical protein